MRPLMLGQKKWFVSGGDLTGALQVPVVTATICYFLLQQKPQQFDILVPVYPCCPDNWPSKTDVVSLGCSVFGCQ